MAGSVNKVILIGNLGKDPESRNMPSGGKVVNLTLATSDNWKDKNTGEAKERTEWHRVVIFNEKIGEFAERYLKKGAKVYVEGTLRTRKWTDQTGQEKYTTEVVVENFKGELTSLGTAASDGASSGGSSYRAETRPAGTSAPKDGWDTSRPGSDLDDEIPF